MSMDVDDKLDKIKQEIRQIDTTLDKSRQKRPYFIISIILAIIIISSLAFFIARQPAISGHTTLDENATNDTIPEQVLGDLQETVFETENATDNTAENPPETPASNITEPTEDDIGPESNQTAENQTADETWENATTENETLPVIQTPSLSIILLSPANNTNTTIPAIFTYSLNDTADNCSVQIMYRYIQQEFYDAAAADGDIGENNASVDVQPGEYLWRMSCSKADIKILSEISAFYAELQGTANQTLNITTNQTMNVTANETNITGAQYNITVYNETYPTQLMQGAAIVGTPVNWTKRILVNGTGNISLTTYIPKEASNINVYEVTSEPTSQKMAVQAEAETQAENQAENSTETPQTDWQEWEARHPKTRSPAQRSIYSIAYHDNDIPQQEGSGQEGIQTPAIIGFSTMGPETQRSDSLFSRFFRWLGSIGTITGAAILGTDDVTLVRPENGAIVPKDLNFIYEAGKDYDSCTLYIDDQIDQKDTLVIAGRAFFDVTGLADGDHKWQIICQNRKKNIWSQSWNFTAGASNGTQDGTPQGPETSLTPVEGADSIEVNITETISQAPKEYQITYQTPAPEAHETESDQYQKTVLITTPIEYQDIIGKTEVPWVPIEFVKFYRHTDAGRQALDAQFFDNNNDNLIDEIQWPAEDNATYDLDLSYEIIRLNLTEAWLIDRQQNISALQELLYEDNITLNPKKAPFSIRFSKKPEQNDTISFTAQAQGKGKIEIIDAQGRIVAQTTIKRDKTQYNATLTITPPSEMLYVIDRGDVEYDSFTAYDKKMIIPKKIKGLDGLTAVLASDENIDVTTQRQSSTAEVLLKEPKGFPVAEIAIDFQNAETDINLSGLIAQTDANARKSVLHMEEWPVAIGMNKTLYIPSSSKGLVYICPDAATLSDVNETCPGVFYLRQGTTSMTIGNETAEFNVQQVEANGTIFYKVDGITGTGGGESLTILNVQSYPSLGSNWTVLFNTTGTADLQITPTDGTTWTEFRTDYINTTNDLLFAGLRCGEQDLSESIIALGSDSSRYNYSQLAESSLPITSILLENYTCNSTGSMTNTEKQGGHHYFLFQFSGVNATAENYVSQISCSLKAKASCSDTHVLYISDTYNAHAELNNQSNYDTALCCEEVYGEALGTNCSATGSASILKLSGQTNAQIEKSTEANYGYEVCLSPSTYYNISCVYAAECAGDDSCVASISSTETGDATNNHIGNCTGTGSYDTKICCATEETKHAPEISGVFLNATTIYNSTNDNLTAWPQNVYDADGDAVKNITNWYVDSKSITVLNMPFEASAQNNESTWAKDYTNLSHHGNVSGAIWNSTGGFDGRGAYEFNNTNTSLINFTILPAYFTHTKNLTIMAWIKPRVLPVVTYQTVVGQGRSNEIFFGTYGTQLGFGLDDGFRFYGAITAGQWTHIAAAYDGSTNQSILYVNGVASTSAYNNDTNGMPTNARWYIGWEERFGTGFNGTIDEVRIYNRTLTTNQILMLYRNQTEEIDSGETSVGDVWRACITPNDGNEDGTEECSNELTIQGAAINVSAIDPLDSWYVNDTIKFECNATSTMPLTSADLWTNYSGTWAQNGSSTSLSGVSAQFEFNRTGFSADVTSFEWACRACVEDECYYASNNTLTIDLAKPAVSLVNPTPATNTRNTTYFNWAYVNVSASDLSNNYSVMTDWNRSLVGWWRLEQGNGTLFADSSTYGNNGTCTATTCPEDWTGMRGKAYRFDGDNDVITVSDDNSLDVNESAFTISVWIYPDSLSSPTAPEILMKRTGATNQTFLRVAYVDEIEFTLGCSDGTLELNSASSAIIEKSWQHVVAVYEPGGTSQIYINGLPSGSPSSVDLGNCNNAADLKLGVGPNGWNFNGSIDEVMFFRRALSAQEINATYQAGLKPYYNNFTSMGSGMVNYTAYAVDQAGNLNQTEYRNFSVNYVPTVTGMVINSSSATNYTSENISVWYTAADSDSDAVKNITTWYLNGTSIAVLNMPFESNDRLNMSTWTKDYSGRGNNGNVSGATWNATGGYDGKGAYQPNSTANSYIKSSNEATFDFNYTGAKFTVMYWVKLHSAPSMTLGVITKKQDFNSDGWALGYDGILRFSDNANWTTTVTGGGLPLGSFVHHTFVFDGDGLCRFYVNGTPTSTIACAGKSFNNNAYPVTIGAYGTPTRYLNATFDDVMIFNRSLTADQISAIYRNQTDKIHFNETAVGEKWNACVTPNDGLEDGTAVCSANLTIRSSGISSTHVDPLNAWYTNDSIKFECNASTSTSLVNATLWLNYSETWVSNGSVSLSGNYSLFEFNRTGMSTDGKSFVWGCYVCDPEECTFSSNRTLTIDLTKPNVALVNPTPVTNTRNTTYFNWAYVNVSASDSSNNYSVMTDWNRSLAGWWRLEQGNGTLFADSSTYGNNATCTGTACPEAWTGMRGKAYRFDGGNDKISLASTQQSIPNGSTFTIMGWVLPMGASGGGGSASIFGLTQGASSNYWSYAVITASGTAFSALIGNSSTITTAACNAVQLNTWSHITMTFNGTAITCYANAAPGTSTATSVLTGTVPAKLTGSTEHIGSAYGGVTYFNGSMDEVMVFTRVLSAQEINATYQAGLKPYFNNFTSISSSRVNYTSYAVDQAGNLNQTEYRNFSVNYVPTVTGMVINSSSAANYTNENISIWYTKSDTDSDTVKNITNWYLNGTSIAVLNMPFESNTQQNMSTWTKDYSSSNNHGTVTSAAWNATGGYDGKGAYSFNRSHRIVLASKINYTSFTFVAWVKPLSFGTYSGIFDNAEYGNDKGWGIVFATTLANLRAFVGNGCGGDVASGITENTWNHIAFTYSSVTGNRSLYVNGTLKANTNCGSVVDYAQTATPAIGQYELSATYGFNGTIDDVQIFNRSLTADQIMALYQNKTDVIDSAETSVGENWNACITPNDGYEDGTSVCSENLTIKSSPKTVTHVDPLDAWYINESIKFECNATGSIPLTTATLYHNYSGTWESNGSTTISGTYAAFEFNRTDMNTDGKSFVWGCYVCDSGDCAFSTNRSLVIDLIKPNVDFVSPTVATNTRNTTYFNWAYVNVSASDSSSNYSVMTDFNRSLVGWWRLENGTGTAFADSSTYANSFTCTGTTCPELWTGMRGKAYRFDGVDDYPLVDNDSPYPMGNSSRTVMAWIYPTVLPATQGMVVGYGGNAAPGAYSEFGMGIDSTGKIGFHRYAGWATVSSATVTLNEWQLIAITYNGTTAQAYLNSAPAGSLSIALVTTSSNTNRIRLGTRSISTAYPFNGSMDEVMIFNRVLSAQEINATYQAASKPYFNNFTSISSGGPWNYTAYAVDQAGNLNQTEYRNYSVNYVPTISGMVINSSSGTNTTNENISIWYTASDTDGDAVKNITNWYLNGTSIAVLNLPFESNTQQNMTSWTKDYSGLGGHGTMTGTANATWNSTGGYDGRGAYSFTKIRDYIVLSNTEQLHITGNAFTVSARVQKRDSDLRSERILEKLNEYIMYIYSGYIYFGVYNTTGGSCQAAKYTDIGSNYRHVVGLYNGTHSVIYLDGAYWASTNCGADFVPIQNANRITISSSASTSYMNGTIDDVMIFNRSLTVDQILLLYRNQTDKIHFNETTLGENWSACVTPNDGYEDGTEVCSENLNITSNSIPQVTTPEFNTSMLYTLMDLKANTTYTDADGDLANVTFVWYVDDVNIYNYTTTGVSTDTIVESTLDNTNFHKHQTVEVSVFAHDGRNESAWNSSVTLTVLNTQPPAPTLFTPFNATLVFTRLPTLIWFQSIDVDGDFVNYTLVLTGGCGADISYSDITAFNKTVEEELKTTDECSQEYNWTVLPFDGEEYGASSAIWTFNVTPVLLLTLYNSTMDFGTMYIGESADSTNDTPHHFELQNDGTVVATILNVTADQSIWQRASLPTEKFQIKVDDSLEPGSFNTTGSAISWTSISLTNMTIISSLNYSDSTDIARIDIKITPPLDEPAGMKNTTLTFYAAQA